MYEIRPVEHFDVIWHGEVMGSFKLRQMAEEFVSVMKRQDELLASGAVRYGTVERAK